MSYPALGVFEHLSRHVWVYAENSKSDQSGDRCWESTREGRMRSSLQLQCSPTIERIMGHVMEVGCKDPKTQPKPLMIE